MLILHDKKNLNEQEVWLHDTYFKILSEIVKRAKNPNSSIDPFASEYFGKNSVKTNSNYYNSFLEITSYFWASKSGRGILLEKTINSLSGHKSEQNVFLSDFLNKLIESDEMLNGKLSNKFKIKFDLINFVNNKLVILELKNRVDSGGVEARRGVLKKFFGLCDDVENNTIALTDSSTHKEYTLSKLFTKLGIKKFEMLMGLLYNISGSQAKIDDDKKDGWYGESKKLVEKYGQKHFGISYDSTNLKICFDKDDVKFLIQTVYGSDSTKEFTGGKLTLDKVFDSVYLKPWDDIWLALNTGIEQRRILLESKTNHILEIQRLYNNNPNFKTKLDEFRKNNSNLIELVNTIQKNIDPLLHIYTDQDVADCLYLCARFI